MRTSTRQVRTATLDAVDLARHRAADVVGTGADLVTAAVDRGASVVEGGIEKVADKVPAASVAVRPRRRTHRLRSLLIGVVVIAVVVAVARRLMGPSEPDQELAVPDAADTTVRGTSGEGEGDVPAGAG